MLQNTKLLMQKKPQPVLTSPISTTTRKALLSVPLLSVQRTAFSSSDPERLSRVIDKDDGLSDYCRFFEFTVEQCQQVEPDSFPTYNPWQFIFFHSPSEHPILMGFIFTVITVISLISTIFFVFLLLKRRKKDFQYPIYTIIMNLSISYSLVALSQCILNVPLYLFRAEPKAVGSDLLLRQITYFIDQFADFSAVFFYLILAVNRLAILSIDRLKVLFQGKLKNLTIGVGWMLALMASVFTMWYGCRKSFDKDRVLFYDDCPPSSRTVFTIFKVLFYTYYALPIMSFIIYIYIGIWITFTRKSFRSESRRIEVDLLLQSAVTLLFYMTILAVYFLQFDFSTEPKYIYIYDMCINGLEVLTGIIFVAVFAISNKTVRKAARKMCFPRRASVRPAPTKSPFRMRNLTRSNTTSFGS